MWVTLSGPETLRARTLEEYSNPVEGDQQRGHGCEARCHDQERFLAWPPPIQRPDSTVDGRNWRTNFSSVKTERCSVCSLNGFSDPFSGHTEHLSGFLSRQSAVFTVKIDESALPKNGNGRHVQKEHQPDDAPCKDDKPQIRERDIMRAESDLRKQAPWTDGVEGVD